MRETLRDGALEPVIILLTHPWFADGKQISPLSGLRGLFVQYPGHYAEPVLAQHCERFESIGAGQGERLADILGGLVA